MTNNNVYLYTQKLKVCCMSLHISKHTLFTYYLIYVLYMLSLNILNSILVQRYLVCDTRARNKDNPPQHSPCTITLCCIITPACCGYVWRTCSVWSLWPTTTRSLSCLIWRIYCNTNSTVVYEHRSAFTYVPIGESSLYTLSKGMFM